MPKDYSMSLNDAMSEIEAQLEAAEFCARMGDDEGVCAASVKAQKQLGIITYDLPVKSWPGDPAANTHIWREPEESEFFRWQHRSEPQVILSSQPAPGETDGYPRATTQQHLQFLRNASFLAYSLMD